MADNHVPAIFLDRDGTINVDRGYISEISKFEFIDNVIDAMRELKKMGFALVLVTNQSGIARGMFSQDQFMQLTKWMNRALAIRDADLNGIYFCPHHPAAIVNELSRVCNCRKPKPGMFLMAKKELHINMAFSYMVGDKIEDMQSAHAAGVGTKVLVRSGNRVTAKDEAAADWVLSSLKDLPKRINQTGVIKKHFK